MADDVKLLSPEKVRMMSASDKLSSEEADRYGDQFFEAGRLSEAMLFYERSKSRDKVKRLRGYAVQQGDAFLLYAIDRLIPDLVNQEHWEKAGDNAMSSKRFIFARDCFLKAENEDRAHQAREEYLKIFEPNPQDEAAQE